MTTISVEVTTEDIAQGTPCRSTRCPLALAIARAIGRVVTVFSPQNGEWRWAIYGSGRYQPLPSVAGRFAGRFDQTAEGEPFSFEVEA